MKKKKMIIGIMLAVVIIGVIVATFYVKKTYDKSYIPLMKMEEYKKMKVDNIKTINIVKYTDDENESVFQEQKNEIKKTYNDLSKYKVGKETKNACFDKRTIYFFELEDGQEVSIEIECDWIVLNEKRYLLKR